MNPLSRLILNIIGTTSLVLAILGAFLPLLPATPFLLLASACYLKSSERMHNWLINHRIFGSYIRNFKEKKALPLRAKIITLALLWASVLFSFYKISYFAAHVFILICAASVTILMFRIKTLKD